MRHHEAQPNRDCLVHRLRLFFLFLLLGTEPSRMATSSAILASTQRGHQEGAGPARRAHPPSLFDAAAPPPSPAAPVQPRSGRGEEHRCRRPRTRARAHRVLHHHWRLGLLQAPGRLPPELTRVCPRGATCVPSRLTPQLWLKAAASMMATVCRSCRNIQRSPPPSGGTRLSIHRDTDR